MFGRLSRILLTALWGTLLWGLALAQDGFDCQGDSLAQALYGGQAGYNCPDQGSQLMSAGGNVTVYLKMANNFGYRG